jgi:hypothetical protein
MEIRAKYATLSLDKDVRPTIGEDGLKICKGLNKETRSWK